MKQCPHCNGDLMDSVIRCVHCGRDLTDPAEAAASPPPDPASTAVAAAVEAPYFAMRTETPPPPSATPPPVVATPAVPVPGASDPQRMATVAGVMGLVGGLITAAGLFVLPLVTVTIHGIDLGPEEGGGSIPSETIGMHFGQWSGLLRILLVISIVMAIVFSIMVLGNGDAKSIARMLGEDVLMAVCVVWLFFSMSGLQEQMSGAADLALGSVAQQIPPDQLGSFESTVHDLTTISTGIGFWAMAAGAAIALTGGIIGALAVKRAKA